MPYNDSSSVAKLPVFVFFPHLHLASAAYCCLSTSQTQRMSLHNRLDDSSSRTPGLSSCSKKSAVQAAEFPANLCRAGSVCPPHSPPYREVRFALKLATMIFILHPLNRKRVFRLLSISFQSILFGVASPGHQARCLCRKWGFGKVPVSLRSAKLPCTLYRARTETRRFEEAAKLLRRIQIRKLY